MFYFRHTEEVVVGYGDSETESDDDGSEEDEDYDLDSVSRVYASDCSVRFVTATKFCEFRFRFRLGWFSIINNLKIKYNHN